MDDDQQQIPPDSSAPVTPEGQSAEGTPEQESLMDKAQDKLDGLKDVNEKLGGVADSVKNIFGM